MALSNDDKLNSLFKASVGKSSTNNAREFFEEPRDGRPIVFPSQVWNEAEDIPATAPTLAHEAELGVVKYFEDLSLTAVPGVPNSFFSDDLIDAIPFNFGDGSYNYVVKDDNDNPIAFGQGDWLLDPNTGTFTFYGTVPANMPPKISFYKYIGTKGVGSGSGGSSGSGLNFISDPFELVTYRSKIVTVNTSTNLVNTTGNNDLPENTEVIYLSDTTAIGGLTSGNTYFLLNSSEGETQLKSTLTGSAINLTASGDGWLIPKVPVGAGDSDVEGRITLTDTDDVDLIGTGLSAQTLTLVSGENCLGDGIKVTVPIASAYEAVDQLLSIAYDLDSTLDEGDIKLFVKDGDNTFIPLLLNTDFNNQADFYRQYFRPNASSIELVLFIDTDDDTASAREFLIDDYILKPAIPVLLNRSLRVISDSVSNVTSSASANFLAGPSITLPVGKWKVTGFIDANNNGSSPAYTSVGLSWRSANGANSATAPALLVSNLNGNIARGLSGLNKNVTPNPTTATGLDAPSFEIDVTTPITIFLVPRVSSSTIGNVLINAEVFAREVENESSTIEALSAAADLEIDSVTQVNSTMAATGNYLVGASCTLEAGKTYEVEGVISYGNNGSNPAYTSFNTRWTIANGANNSTPPSLLVNNLNGNTTWGLLGDSKIVSTSGSFGTLDAPSFIIKVINDITFYLVPRALAGTPSNARVSSTITVKELPHTNVALYPKVPDAELILSTSTGYGSTANRIHIYSNILKNTGAGFYNYVTSAANGGSIEILQDGDYKILMQAEYSNANREFGITKNQSSLTTNITDNPVSEVLVSGCGIQDRRVTITDVVSLKKGDIIRANGDGGTIVTGADDNRLSIKLISLR